MVLAANLVTVAILVGLGFLFQEIEWNWGRETMVIFTLGFIVATVIWQTAHKMRYGHWFDDPVINPEDAPADGSERGKGR